MVEVKIRNNISGVLADGKRATTYSPNYPELINKLSNGVDIIIAQEDKMPSLLEFTHGFNASAYWVGYFL